MSLQLASAAVPARRRDSWVFRGACRGADPELFFATDVNGRMWETDPRVIETQRDAQRTHREQHRLTERQLYESTALHRQILGSATPSTAITRAIRWRNRAEQARHDLAEIEALPVAKAAQFVRERVARVKAEREAAERAQAALDVRAARLGQFRPSSDHGRTGPERDFGPSL